MKRRWEESGEACPKCQRETEIATIDDDDGHEYIDAERCRNCRWIVEFFPFEDREPETKRY